MNAKIVKKSKQKKKGGKSLTKVEKIFTGYTFHDNL